MGTVRKRKWKGRDVFYIDYIAADGRRIRQTIGPGEEGRRLARKVLAQREAEAQLGIHRLPAGRTPTFAEFAQDWLYRRRARLRPKTVELYEDLLQHHLLPVFGQMRLGAISRRAVEAFLATHASMPRPGRAAPPAPKTTNHCLTVLKTILGDAVDQGVLAENPAARVKPIAQRDHEDLQILTPEEIARLLDAAEEPWRTLYFVAVHTGLRRGELLALRQSDLDLRKGLLHVRRSLGRVRDGEGYAVREAPLKTKHSRRTIDLSPTTVEVLLALPAGDDPDRDFVFRSRAGGPIDPDNVDRAWKRHLATAGLADRPFHSTRHTHASLLIAAGVHPKAIQARLGHASITTTLNTYGHLMPSAFEGVGARLDALLDAPVMANSRQIRDGNEKAGLAESPKPASIKGIAGVTDGT